MSVYTTRETCRLCGSKKLITVARLPDSPAGDDFVSSEHLDKVQHVCPVEVMVCQCGQVQLHHNFNPDLIYLDYIYQTKNSLGLVKHFEEYAAEVYQRNPCPGGLAVEMGSNAGDLLMALKGMGMRVLGVDPARDISQQATQAGVPTIPEYFTFELAHKIRDEHGSASLIIANNVLANIDDLADVAEGVRHLLADDGIFVFETSYLMDVLKYALVDTIFHEHLSYFSVSPLVEFFRAHGMELFGVEHVDTKGGSIRCYVKLRCNPTPVSQDVLKFLKAEKFGLAQAHGWYDFNRRLVDTRQWLMLILEELQHAGKRIAAYGASDGCTQMVYVFDLAQYVDVILDDNPGKIGKYSPGYHIPVKSSAEIDSVDAVVILAWRYTDNILRRNSNFKGTWIRVMP